MHGYYSAVQYLSTIRDPGSPYPVIPSVEKEKSRLTGVYSTLTKYALLNKHQLRMGVYLL